jgi:hypothetical protein
MDDTGGVVASYSSDAFYATNYTADTWSNLSVNGKAPSGSVTGRTLCAVLGADDAFAGAVWFDDLSQSVISSGEVTQTGALYNPGFEDGMTGNAYYLSNSLPNWGWAGGTNAGFIVDAESQSGYQSLQIVYPNNMAYQWFDAETGMSYIVEGYMMTPSSGGITDTTAFASLLLEFYDPEGNLATTSVSSVSTEQLTHESDKDTWLYFSVTNHAPWSGPCSGKVSCAFLDLEEPYAGASVFFDSLSVTATNIPVPANSQSGALWNPGFEYSARGTKLPYIDNWENLGFDGNVDGALARSGDQALKITYPETLLAQYWTAVPGYKYSTEAWISSPSGDNKFTTSTNCTAVLLLQYLDETGTNILQTYMSDPYTGDADADVWSNLMAIGVAPAGTVTGRTVCAVLGYDDAFSGAVWFDDVSQSLVSTGTSLSGLIYNGGFDDGVPGNCYNLATNNGLLGWKWFGGDDAGYIGGDYAKDGEQCALMTWPNNFLVQEWTATSGEVYVAEGYMYTPSDSKFDSDGTSYGRLEMSFYVNGSSDPVAEAITYSASFTRNTSADTWHYFAVTGTAPAGVAVTGRVSCTIYSDDPDEDWDLAGVICFDQLAVQAEGSGTDAWADWQQEQFGSTTAPDGGPDDDYDGDDYSNWSEFIAGTQPTNAASVMTVTGTEQASGDQVVLRWPSTAGRYYGIMLATNTVSDTFSYLTNNIVAIPPENVYTATAPSGVSRYYYRVVVNTNTFE